MEFTEKEQAFIQANKEQVNEMFVEKEKNLISKTAFEQGLKEVKDLFKGTPEALAQIVEQQKANEDALKAQGLTLAQIKNTEETSKEPSFKMQVEKNLKSNTEGLESLKTMRKPLTFSLKAVADMTTGNYTTGTVGVSQYDTELGRPARRRTMLQDVVSRRRVTTAYVSWADHANAEGGAASQVGENAAKSQADFEMVESNKRVETIASYITTSTQALDDVPYLTDTINTELRELVELKLEDQLLTGAGTSNTLKGIQTYATAWTATGYLVDLVIAPTIYDVIINGQAQVSAANHYPTHVLMNPVDIAKMISTSRASDGVYLNPNFAKPIPDGLVGMNVGTINGLQIISTNAVTANKLYVIDATKSVLGMREDFTITIDRQNDNLTKNMITILGEIRAVHYIRANNTTAFVYVASISSAIADLLKP